MEILKFPFLSFPMHSLSHSMFEITFLLKLTNVILIYSLLYFIIEKKKIKREREKKMNSLLTIKCCKKLAIVTNRNLLLNGRRFLATSSNLDGKPK